jgi:hypothetical protein
MASVSEINSALTQQLNNVLIKAQNKFMLRHEDHQPK